TKTKRRYSTNRRADMAATTASVTLWCTLLRRLDVTGELHAVLSRHNLDTQSEARRKTPKEITSRLISPALNKMNFRVPPTEKATRKTPKEITSRLMSLALTKKNLGVPPAE
ncbi:hypothetical protein HPB47_023076, partial [Ixodes persulcatus]